MSGNSLNKLTEFTLNGSEIRQFNANQLESLLSLDLSRANTTNFNQNIAPSMV